MLKSRLLPERKAPLPTPAFSKASMALPQQPLPPWHTFPLMPLHRDTTLTSLQTRGLGWTSWAQYDILQNKVGKRLP